jgi:hypothetical protein
MDSALFEAVTDLEAVPQQADEEFAVPAEAPASVVGKQNLYFVRVPRPHVDDAPVKELQTKLSAVLTKLKEYNKKLAAKRVRCAPWGLCTSPEPHVAAGAAAPDRSVCRGGGAADRPNLGRAPRAVVITLRLRSQERLCAQPP